MEISGPQILVMTVARPRSFPVVMMVAALIVRRFEIRYGED